MPDLCLRYQQVGEGKGKVNHEVTYKYGRHCHFHPKLLLEYSVKIKRIFNVFFVFKESTSA